MATNIMNLTTLHCPEVEATWDSKGQHFHTPWERYEQPNIRAFAITSIKKKKNKMCTHAAMRIECLAVHELCPGQTCFPQMIANHYRETQSILSPLNIVALQRRMFLQHSKIRIVIAYMYGIMIIERSSLVGQFPWPNKSCFLPKRLLISSQDRVRIVLLLLLLRRLSSLVLKLLDRLLRVALVAAVGLDLYHKLALAKDPLSLSFACVLVASPRLADSNLQRFRYH